MPPLPLAANANSLPTLCLGVQLVCCVEMLCPLQGANPCEIGGSCRWSQQGFRVERTYQRSRSTGSVTKRFRNAITLTITHNIVTDEYRSFGQDPSASILHRSANQNISFDDLCDVTSSIGISPPKSHPKILSSRIVFLPQLKILP